MSEWVIDVGDQDFEAQVIERSRQTPVVVDFWAPWCGPCRTLGPLLERLTDEHAGAFVLAKVNIDDNPGLSQALNIQSIPLVIGFRDGRIVSEFLGAVPETAVREFLAKLLPSDADRLADSADELFEAGKHDEAEVAWQRAVQLDPRCDRALLGLARIAAERRQDGEALELSERIAPGPHRQAADRLAAEIRIRQSGTGDEQSLRAKLAADPDDLQTRFLLGQVLAAASKHAEALEQYLEVLRRDRTFQDGAARKAMLTIFDALGAGHPDVDHYRSELAKVLFS